MCLQYFKKNHTLEAVDEQDALQTSICLCAHTAKTKKLTLKKGMFNSKKTPQTAIGKRKKNIP